MYRCEPCAHTHTHADVSTKHVNICVAALFISTQMHVGISTHADIIDMHTLIAGVRMQ